MTFDDRSADQLTCSFCQRAQLDVEKLVAGPGVYICDRCVTACQDLIVGQAPRRRPPADS